MYEQKSNLGSILVAVLAIALILGGVFLLNQSFNSGRNKDLSAVSTSSSSSLLAIGRSSSSGLLAVTESNSSSENSKANSSDKSSNSSQENSSENSSNKSESNSSKNSTLKTGEFTARAITPTAKGSNWEIIDCNVEEVFFCKTGFKFPFSTSGTVGKTYKFSGGTVTDSKDGLAVSSINPTLID